MLYPQTSLCHSVFNCHLSKDLMALEDTGNETPERVCLFKPFVSSCLWSLLALNLHASLWSFMDDKMHLLARPCGKHSKHVVRRYLVCKLWLKLFYGSISTRLFTELGTTRKTWNSILSNSNSGDNCRLGKCVLEFSHAGKLRKKLLAELEHKKTYVKNLAKISAQELVWKQQFFRKNFTYVFETLQIRGQVLPKCSNIKFLGVVIDDKLSSPHT